MPHSRITVMFTVHFYILVLLLLDGQIWQRLSTNTSCPQGKFPLIPPCFLALALIIYSDYYSCPQRSRETGTFFQSLKLIQTVSNSCWNFSNMFVAELVVIASVNYSIGHSLEGLLAYSILPRSKTLSGWLCVMSVYAQQECCTGVVSSCAW